MDLTRHLQSSAPGVGYAVDSGKAMAQKNNYQLVDKVSWFFQSVTNEYTLI